MLFLLETWRPGAFSSISQFPTHLLLQPRDSMDPVVFKKENRRKENITPSTFVAPKPTHRLHSEYTEFEHVPRASQGPWDAPEDTWMFVGTNTDLQLSSRRGCELKGQSLWTKQSVGAVGLELNISSCSGGEGTDRFSSQQDVSFCAVYMWEVKDKLKNETASNSRKPAAQQWALLTQFVRAGQPKLRGFY